MTHRIKVKGRDISLAAYRIQTDAGQAMVPEFLMVSALRPGARPSHQEAYEWIAANRTRLARSVAQLAAGQTPRAPFDHISLVGHPQ